MSPTQPYNEDMYEEGGIEEKKKMKKRKKKKKYILKMQLVDMGDEKMRLVCMFCDVEDVGAKTRERITRQFQEAADMFGNYDHLMDKEVRRSETSRKDGKNLSKLKEFQENKMVDERDRESMIEQDIREEQQEKERFEQQKGRELVEENLKRHNMEQEQGAQWAQDAMKQGEYMSKDDGVVHESIWMNDEEWEMHLETEIRDGEEADERNAIDEMEQEQAWGEVVMDEQHSEYHPGTYDLNSCDRTGTTYRRLEEEINDMEDIRGALFEEEVERANEEWRNDERDNKQLFEEAEDAVIDAMIEENAWREERERPVPSGDSSGYDSDGHHIPATMMDRRAREQQEMFEAGEAERERIRRRVAAFEEAERKRQNERRALALQVERDRAAEAARQDEHNARVEKCETFFRKQNAEGALNIDQGTLKVRAQGYMEKIVRERRDRLGGASQ